VRAGLEAEIAAFNPMPVQERSLYRAGEWLQETGRGLVALPEGYDERSISVQLSRGLGSMIVGIPISLATGPVGGGVFFGGMGIGEATQRAVEFDKAERAAGRRGLTQDQVVLAGLLGVGPGTTDVLPIENMLGRLSIPGLTPGVSRILASAISRSGGRILWQAAVEGGQEGLQQVLQNYIAREVYNPNQNLGEDVVPNIAIGGGVGMIAQGGTEAARGLLSVGRRARAAAQPTHQGAPQDTLAWRARHWAADRIDEAIDPYLQARDDRDREAWEAGAGRRSMRPPQPEAQQAANAVGYGASAGGTRRARP
jgi:hypothetical protein